MFSQLNFCLIYAVFYSIFSYMVFYLIEEPDVILNCLSEPALNWEHYQRRNSEIVEINYPYGVGNTFVLILGFMTALLAVTKFLTNKFTFIITSLLGLYFFASHSINPSKPGCDDHRYPLPDIPILYIFIILVFLVIIAISIWNKFKTEST